MPRDKNIFTLNPTSLDMRRSVFNRNSQHKTSFNLGQLVPLYLDEILPGDTVSLDLSQVIRMSTPISPIMDNIYMDVYAFFVPNRLVWNHWQQFCGENDTGAWTQTTSYTIPVADIGMSSGNELDRDSIGAYFGLPIKTGHLRSNLRSYVLPNKCEVSELPLRAYYKIANDWFFDENSIGPRVFTIGDTANTTIKYKQAPVRVSRFHDLFSSCLPAPQKGASVVLPLGTAAPVVSTDQFGPVSSAFVASTMKFAHTGTGLTVGAKYTLGMEATGANNAEGEAYTGDPGTKADGLTYPNNLYADLSKATAATINQLRYAFQVQKLLEKDARGGTRYIELLKAHFGVTSPDARLQRSEYLAGHRFRINVDQVLATTDTTGTGSQGLGQTGAFSKTAQAGSLFTKSFVEHGMLIIVGCVRQDHTYSQGLDNYWLKKERFDFYYPVLANIGEVPVYKSQIDVYNKDASNALDAGSVGAASGVFGYQEAWFDYRFKPSRCTGYMNPIVDGSLNYWTLGDVYASVPGLNSTFLNENGDFLDRALKVQSSVMHQFIADFYFKAKFSRVMPLYSIPGLIDHH